MTFNLPENIHIHDAEKIWNKFIFLINGMENEIDKNVVINAERLRNIDTAGLQLILAMKRILEYQGKEYRVINVYGGLAIDIDSYGSNTRSKVLIDYDFMTDC